MKKLFTFLAVISMTFSIFGQAPQKMSYQCVIRNASGVLVTNHSVGIRISILQGTATGTVVYQEIYNPNPQTNTNGLLSIEIGGGLAITGTFSAIDWASGPYFLETETDPSGGTNYTIVGTSQLLSVPYAMYAKTAGNAFSGNYYDLTNKPILFSGNYNDLTNKPTLFNGTWANITDKPTTLIGYGISDAMSTSHVANGITSSLIGNWNTAFSWGNHAGLYKPISYVPSWSEITNKPTTLDSYGIIDAVNTTGNQTIGGNKTFTGIINSSSQTITNVANPVNAQDAATKSYVDALAGQITMLKNTLKAGGLVTDIDGNSYNTVVIGTQTWMAENLKTTKYNDGTPIPYVIDPTVWSSLATPAYCLYNNDAITYKATYGALYNWYSVHTGKLCPAGWHVPSYGDYFNLFGFYNILNGNLGNVLMESGSTHWVDPLGTNESGFTALPAGDRLSDGTYFGIGTVAEFWCSDFDTMFNWTESYHMHLPYWYHATPGTISTSNIEGLSVRCLKD